MSNPGQAQPGPNKDSFITLEDIDSFKSVKDEQKNQMRRYLKDVTERIQASPEGSAEHQGWVQKLKEFTGKLRSQLYRQQASEHAQQAQNRIAQQGQAKSQPQPGQTQQAQQGQQQSSQPATQPGSQQSQYSAEVVQRVRGLQVPYPPDMSQADTQKYVQEQRKQYANLLSQHENAEKLRQQQVQLAEQKRSQGQDPSPELAKIAKAEDYLRKNKINIETFERKQLDIRARQQAAQQNGGAMSTAGSQTQQNISQPGQTRPNQPGGQSVNAGAENGRSPTSPTQPAQQQSQSHQQSQHATTQPPSGAHPNLAQHPQQNLSQQQTTNANASRPPLNIQQANAQASSQLSNQASPRTAMASGSAPGAIPNGVQALSHEAAISAAARSYSQTTTQQPSSTPSSQQQQQQQQQSSTSGSVAPSQQQRPTPQSATSGPAPPPLQTGSNLHLGGASGNGTPGSSTGGVLSSAGTGYVGGVGGGSAGGVAGGAGGAVGGGGGGHTVRFPIPKTLNTTSPLPPVSMGAAARPTLGGPVNGAPGMVGQPAVQKQPGYILEGEGDRVLSKKKLDELVRQVTGGGEGPGESLTPEVEEAILQMADDFVDNVVTAACRVAKLRPSATLDLRDLQLVVERNYNIRVPGYASDEVRTVRKFQPAPGWTQKMNAVQAAKVMGGKTDI
ncbi:MAG: hypothetical protein Q9165_004891 [Trypethelium subeluteriae]